MPLESDLVTDDAWVGLGPLDVGFGLAMGYRQNSWPRSAREDSCWRLRASRNARGRVNCTGSSSLWNE